MTQPATARLRMSIPEYLRFEFDAEQKHEYAEGQVLDMAGATGEHSLITMNIGGELRSALKGKPCRVYDSNLRVRSPADGDLPLSRSSGDLRRNPV